MFTREKNKQKIADPALFSCLWNGFRGDFPCFTERSSRPVRVPSAKYLP
jgi:hypothetical protein